MRTNLSFRRGKQVFQTARRADRQAQNPGNQDLQAGVSGICKSGTTAVDADRDTADQITESNGDTSPKQSIAGIVVVLGVELAFGNRGELRREDDCDDHAVNGDDLAENNGNQVLGADSGCSHTTADDRRAREEDTPAPRRPVSHCDHLEPLSSSIPTSANRRTTNAQPDTDVRPGVRRYLLQEAADLCIVSAMIARRFRGGGHYLHTLKASPCP